jgi:hypothetical protein
MQNDKCIMHFAFCISRVSSFRHFDDVRVLVNLP